MPDKFELVDAKWLAGFFDGEGSIGLRGSGYMSPAATIPQSGEQGRRILVEIKSWLEQNGVGCSEVALYKTKHLPAYSIRVTSRANVSKLISLLVPHLRIKKAAAQDLLRFLVMYPSLREGSPAALLKRERGRDGR